MISSRYFLCRVTIVRLACQLYSTKILNAIKQLNYENRCLYGSVIKCNKTKKKIKEAIEEPDVETHLEELTLNQGSKKIKAIKNINRKQTLLQNIPPFNCNVDEISSRDNSVIFEKTVSSLEKVPPTKKRIKVLKNETSSLLHNDFIFKSSLLLNEKNFPLENERKLVLDNMASETVLNYRFSDSAVEPYLKFPSVTKIMEETMSDKNRLILNRWRQNMIRDLGHEGFSKHFEDLKSRGHDFHSAMCTVVQGGVTPDSSAVTQNALRSLEWMLAHVTHPLAVESLTAHPHLEYKGIPDCVLHFRGIPVVVDWKLSDKPKKDLKDTYDAPVQISAYIGALNHDPNYSWAVNHGLVAVAYTSGEPCDVFLLAPKHCQVYWRHWLARCDKFKSRSHLHTEHVIDDHL